MDSGLGKIDKIFVATKAFIEHEGKILILQESSDYEDGTNEGKFDVPGGRIKPGQTYTENLHREIAEETALNVKIAEPFFVSEWYPEVKNENWQIIGIFFKCESQTDKIKLSEDHSEFAWIDPHEYAEFNLIENLNPVFKKFNNINVC